MSLSLLAAIPMMMAAALPNSEPVAACSDIELELPLIGTDKVDAQRLGPPPAIDYAAGSAPERWGFVARLRVDAQGRVRCYQLVDRWGQVVETTPEREQWVRNLDRLRYRPFIVDGQPAAVIVEEEIREYERPERHRPLPEAPLGEVALRLERGPCFGACPVYSVEIFGDGRAVYEGKRFVDVTGRHEYRIDPAKAQALIDSLRDKDLWSMKTEYFARVTDHPSYTLRLRMGEQTHDILDYVGHEAGMPPAVTEFEGELDQAADSAGWIQLSSAAIERLLDEGFDFASAEAGALLARAAQRSESGGDAALIRMLELGTATAASGPMDPEGDESGDLLIDALKAGRSDFAIALIDAGAIAQATQQDSGYVDEAFQAAIRGGSLKAAQHLWSIAGTEARPSLRFTDADDEGRTREAPVTLLLEAPYGPRRWQGLELARWLSSLGCDLKARGADGHTLLHVAAKANQPDFVRYLLEQGVDPTTPGAYGLAALGSTHNEDVALMLLQAGTDPGAIDSDAPAFRDFAQSQHWQRVLDWLDAQPR